MKKGWRIITIIVLVAIVLGAVSIGVGIAAGGNFQRIYEILDSRYHINAYRDAYVPYVRQIISQFTDLVVETWKTA